MSSLYPPITKHPAGVDVHLLNSARVHSRFNGASLGGVRPAKDRLDRDRRLPQWISANRGVSDARRAEMCVFLHRSKLDKRCEILRIRGVLGCRRDQAGMRYTRRQWIRRCRVERQFRWWPQQTVGSRGEYLRTLLEGDQLARDLSMGVFQTLRRSAAWLSFQITVRRFPRQDRRYARQ